MAKSQNISYKLRDRALDAADRDIVTTVRSCCGLEIESIDDLVNTRARYPEAYSALVSLLHHDYPIRMREMLVRALTVPDAHDAAYDDLLRLYKSADRDFPPSMVGYQSYTYALANALSVLARKADRRTLLDLARDPRYGRSRTAFVNAMRRWKSQDADDFIIEALNDHDIEYAAIEAAAARRLATALPRIAELARSSNPEVARVAKRAVNKLQSAK
jgi:hypothetical protein